MVDENYSSFTESGPNKGNYKPGEPENHRKERKREREREREKEKKRLAIVFSFYSVDLRKPVPKVSAERHSQTLTSLTKSDLVFTNPGI